MPFKNISMFYITVASKHDAQNLISVLLEKKLIACAQIVQANSMYTQSNRLQNIDEHIIIAKSLPENNAAIVTAIKKMHSYTTPCILYNNWNVNDEYYLWVKNEVNISS